MFRNLTLEVLYICYATLLVLIKFQKFTGPVALARQSLNVFVYVPCHVWGFDLSILWHTYRTTPEDELNLFKIFKIFFEKFLVLKSYDIFTSNNQREFNKDICTLDIINKSICIKQLNQQCINKTLRSTHA